MFELPDRCAMGRTASRSGEMLRKAAGELSMAMRLLMVQGSPRLLTSILDHDPELGRIYGIL